MTSGRRRGTVSQGASLSSSSQHHASKPRKRHATVYDAVAGRVGLNGFLIPSRTEPTLRTPLAPQEVLLRRVNAPHKEWSALYDADDPVLKPTFLPDSALLESLHTYTSDFYAQAASYNGRSDFRSLDETALLALGILLEEACTGILGENGDMVLVEPEGLETGLPEGSMTRHQIKGRVKPQPTADLGENEPEDSDDMVNEDNREAKKRRRT